MKSARAARPTVLIEPGLRRKVQGAVGSALRRIHMARYLSRFARTMISGTMREPHLTIDSRYRSVSRHGEFSAVQREFRRRRLPDCPAAPHAPVNPAPFTRAPNNTAS